MRSITKLGLALTVGGFLAGGGGFAALAWSGSLVIEADWTPRDEGTLPRVETVPAQLDPEMNPLAATLSIDDSGAKVAIRILNPVGAEIFASEKQGSPGGEASWFYSPIDVTQEGVHQIECTVHREAHVNIELRRNAIVPSPMWLGLSVLGVMGGFVLLAVGVAGRPPE